MSATVQEKKPTVADDARTIADCISRGEKVPPDVRKRVEERGAAIEKRVFDEFGLVNIGLPAIRELRDR